MIVVDTNLLVYSVLEGETPDLADRIDRLAARDADWIAPSLWRHELANALATAMRVRGLTMSDAVVAFSAAERLVVDAEFVPSVETKLDLAARGKISAYDAEFVAVAEELGLPLLTTDRRLALAFPGKVCGLAEFLGE